MKPDSRIIISRTDSIGDVVLTLPMAGLLKRQFPQCYLIFLGKNYTREVVALSEHVDEFLNYDEIRELATDKQIDFIQNLKADVILHVYPRKEIAMLAEKAGIPLRIGTLSRLYHWYTCNRKIHLPRRNSPLHEAQLNISMLKGLALETGIEIQGIPEYYGFSKLPQLPEKMKSWPEPSKFNLILHPRSNGSAREWGLDNFSKVIDTLPENKFKIFVSGTKQEGDSIREWIDNNPRVQDLTGKMNLREFIAFIAACDGLVAASTGPLHLAAALGKVAIGLFAPMRPIHPGRWQALGPKAHALVIDKVCNACRKGGDCACIREIAAQQVVDLLLK